MCVRPMWHSDKSERSNNFHIADFLDLTDFNEHSLSEMEPCAIGDQDTHFRLDLDWTGDPCVTVFAEPFEDDTHPLESTADPCLAFLRKTATELETPAFSTSVLNHHHHHYHHYHHFISANEGGCIAFPGIEPALLAPSCVPSSTGSSTAASPLREPPPKRETARERIRVRTKTKNPNPPKGLTSRCLRQSPHQSQGDAADCRPSPTHLSAGRSPSTGEKQSSSSSSNVRDTDAISSKDENEIAMRPFENMKTTQLRHELCVRRAPIYGTKHELLERLRLKILGPGSIPNDSPPLTAVRLPHSCLTLLQL